MRKFSDYQPKTAIIPGFVEMAKPDGTNAIEVEVFANDTITLISDYLFGTTRIASLPKLKKLITESVLFYSNLSANDYLSAFIFKS